jgi:hypothetical protein
VAEAGSGGQCTAAATERKERCEESSGSTSSSRDDHIGDEGKPRIHMQRSSHIHSETYCQRFKTT